MNLQQKKAEHTALLAVAEAARKVNACLTGRVDYEFIHMGNNESGGVETPAKLIRTALANLESVREGKAVKAA